MAQNITIANATYPSVPAIDVPKQGGGTARYSDASVTTATASDVKQGKIFVNAQGNQDAGTYVPTTPTGNINITQAGVTDVTNYATATVPVAIGSAEMSDYYSTESSVRKYTVEADGLITDAGWVFLGYQQAFHGYKTYNAVPKNTTITPTTSAQTIGGANYMMEGAVTVAAMPTGTAGTPTAAKGAVSNHSVTVTPSVTNTTGYITGSTKTGTAVTVSASELVSGSETKTANGTYDVTNLAELVVNVSGGGGAGWQVDTKTITASNYPVSIQFTSMKGEPKAFFLKSTSQISSSGSTTYYYIIAMRYNGTNTTGSCFRIGSTRRVDPVTSGYSWSYSGTTLTITSSASSRSASPGAFNNGYELTYFY